MEIVRIPLIEAIAPSGTFVLKMAFEFFTIEKHNINCKNPFAKQTTGHANKQF